MYNWNDKPANGLIKLSDLWFAKNINWKTTTDGKLNSIKLQNGVLSIESQPTHSVRVIYLED